MIEAAAQAVRIVRRASPEASPRHSLSPSCATEQHTSPGTEPASAAARGCRARRKRRPTRRVLQANQDTLDISKGSDDDDDSPAPSRKRQRKTGMGSDQAAAAASLEAAAEGDQELLPAVTRSSGHISPCVPAPTVMPTPQAALQPAAPAMVTPPSAAEALPAPAPSVQRWASLPAATDAAPDATRAAAVERVRSPSAGHSTATRYATGLPPNAHLAFASDAAIPSLRLHTDNHSPRSDSCRFEQLSPDGIDVAALDSSISAVLGDNIGAAAAAAAAAAVSELFATRLGLQ